MSNETESIPPPSFESALRELEESVQRLEGGELPLEESLALFEKGVGSLKRCHAILDQADKRIRVLVRSLDGAPELRDATAAPLTGSGFVPPKKSGKVAVDSVKPA